MWNIDHTFSLAFTQQPSKILKGGKEPMGHRLPGTMVVVEEGSGYVGGEVRWVTSALQTSAGRMIFARASAFA